MEQNRKRNIAVFASFLVITLCTITLIGIQAAHPTPTDTPTAQLEYTPKSMVTAELLQANGTNWLFIGNKVYQSNNITDLTRIFQEYFGEP